MKEENIVRFANESLTRFHSRFFKRKMVVMYWGIELTITKKSTVFSIVKEYKEKNKVRTDELIKLVQEQIERVKNLKLNFPF